MRAFRRAAPLVMGHSRTKVILSPVHHENVLVCQHIFVAGVLPWRTAFPTVLGPGTCATRSSDRALNPYAIISCAGGARGRGVWFSIEGGVGSLPICRVLRTEQFANAHIDLSRSSSWPMTRTVAHDVDTMDPRCTVHNSIVNSFIIETPRADSEAGLRRLN